jgi:hypothetical protein
MAAGEATKVTSFNFSINVDGLLPISGIWLVVLFDMETR